MAAMAPVFKLQLCLSRCESLTSLWCTPLRNSFAKARIEQVSAKSSLRTSSCALGSAARILAAASSPFSTSLQAIITRAPGR